MENVQTRRLLERDGGQGIGIQRLPLPYRYTEPHFGDPRLSEKTVSVSRETGEGGGSTSTPARPPPAMGLVDTTLFLVTAGCTLQWTATAASTGPSSLLVWLIGGLTMFVPIAVCVVYLCSRFPDAGGIYAWSTRAFGPFAGFITGWTYWTGTLAFLPTVLYFISGSSLLWSPANTHGCRHADLLHLFFTDHDRDLRDTERPRTVGGEVCSTARERLRDGWALCCWSASRWRAAGGLGRPQSSTGTRSRRLSGSTMSFSGRRSLSRGRDRKPCRS